MFPILYDSVVTGTVPDHYGIGVLKDALSCEITEERNGEYELTLKYPSSGAYANQLVPRAIIKAKPNYTDDPQLFRIYKVGKVLGSSFSVYARHISYDLSGFPITTGSANNIGDALILLNNHATGYTFSTDKSLQASFKIDTPSSVRSWFGGKAGSILDLYGPGEWKYNNFTCQFLANRGIDRGVTIRYGKNLTKLENTDDSSNLVTSIMAFWKSTDDDNTVIISDAISTGATLDVTACQILDASEYYENQPTKAQLNTYVNNYISSHITDRVQKNIKLDFAQISKLLKDRVDLCDTVHIIYEDYGISATAKCIKTTWDVLQDKYTEIELGEARTNIADTIVGINKDLAEQLTANQVKSAIRDATDVITGNKGGYVVLHDSDEDGYPDELLIMNTADISTATKVWRWNLSGLGYSSNGYSGPFGLAMTMDGAIVADYIKTGNLVFGGSGNTDGKLEIRDTQGNLICRFDKTGAEVKGDIIADSFTADAGENIKIEALTKDFVVSYIGKKSGLMIIPNGATLPVAGIGVDPNYTNNSSVFVADQSSLISGSYPKISTLRSWHPSTITNNSGRHLGIETIYRRENNSGNNQLSSSYCRSGEHFYSNDSGGFDSTMLSELSVHVESEVDSNNRTIYGRVEADCKSNGTHGIAQLSVQYESGRSISFSNNKNSQSISISNNKGGNNQTFGMYNTNNNNSISMSNSYNYQYLSMSSGGTPSIYLNGNNGNITCVSLTQTSSKKYKKKIKTLTDEEAKKILELRPVTYDFKDEAKGVNMRGFIAEEVDEVIPELVKHTKDYPVVTTTIDEDGNEVIQEHTKDEVSLDYIAMIPYLTKMVQLQQKQIDDQQKQINDLKNEINKLKGEC